MADSSDVSTADSANSTANARSSSIKAEFHNGARDSRQVLFQNNLFGYFRNNTWRCVHKKSPQRFPSNE